MLMRELTANFVRLNKKSTINGLPLLHGLTHATTDEYILNELLLDGCDAKGLTLVMLPLVLRNPICIVIANPYQPEDKCKLEEYKSQIEEFKFQKNDLLNLHKEESIYVLFKPGHYDIIYNDNYLLKNPLLIKYDCTCSICKKFGYDITLECGHLVHNKCIQSDIKNLTNGYVLLTKDEETIYNGMYKCPSCIEIIVEKDLLKIFSKEILEAYKKYKKTREDNNIKPNNKQNEVKANNNNLDNLIKEKQKKYKNEIIINIISHTNCCDMEISISVLIEAVKDIFDIDKGKWKLKNCPFCGKSSIDWKNLLGEDLFNLHCQSICCICKDPNISQEAFCNLHYTCTRCSYDKKCRICDLLKIVKYDTNCSCCNKGCIRTESSLMTCFHVICKDCIKSNPYCDSCKSNKQIIRVI